MKRLTSKKIDKDKDLELRKIADDFKKKKKIKEIPKDKKQYNQFYKEWIDYMNMYYSNWSNYPPYIWRGWGYVTTPNNDNNTGEDNSGNPSYDSGIGGDSGGGE